MATKNSYVCDGCGAAVDNPYAAKGWLTLHGSVSRAHGRYSGSSYVTDYLREGTYHLCSVKCLVAALNKVRDESKAAAPNPKESPRGE